MDELPLAHPCSIANILELPLAHFLRAIRQVCQIANKFDLPIEHSVSYPWLILARYLTSLRDSEQHFWTI